MKKLNGKSDREKSLLSNAMLQAAPGIACRCPLPGKYLPVRARQPLAGRIAASSRQSRSLSVALQMSARASTAAQKAGLPLCFLQDLNFLFRFSGLH